MWGGEGRREGGGQRREVEERHLKDMSEERARSPPSPPLPPPIPLWGSVKERRSFCPDTPRRWAWKGSAVFCIRTKSALDASLRWCQCVNGEAGANT